MNITIPFFYCQLLMIALLFPLWKWWYKTIVQKPSDTYSQTNKDGYDYSMIYILITPFAIISSIQTIIFFANEDLTLTNAPKEVIVFYLVFFYLGPFSILLGILRAFGLGHTKIGSLVGIYPPTTN